MNPSSVMIVAGETSGDMLAAELVRALRTRRLGTDLPSGGQSASGLSTMAPRFFGAGGPHMEQAGVELDFDLTRHSVIGLWEPLKNIGRFRKLFKRLVALAAERQPDAVIGVDFSGLNRRLAGAIKRLAQSKSPPFHNWNPKFVQFVSPQVWASRPGRARQMSRCYDLVLSIFPFEPAWYAQHAPLLPVRFVGHPMLDRYANRPRQRRSTPGTGTVAPRVLFLAGSRRAELQRHLPVMLGALALMRKAYPNIQAHVVLPNAQLATQTLGLHTKPDPKLEFDDDSAMASDTSDAPTGVPAGAFSPVQVRDGVTYRVGGLAEELVKADLAIASTGTVTMECAYFGVPMVAIYKTSWSTYQVGKRIVSVQHLAMPNIMAGRTIVPELIQEQATPENIAREALDILNKPERHQAMRAELARVIDSLGPPGACQRAAAYIQDLWNAAD